MAHEMIDAEGVEVEVLDRSATSLRIAVDAWDRSSARVTAESFGEVIESDYTDGRWLFVIKSR